MFQVFSAVTLCAYAWFLRGLVTMTTHAVQAKIDQSTLAVYSSYSLQHAMHLISVTVTAPVIRNGILINLTQLLPLVCSLFVVSVNI